MYALTTSPGAALAAGTGTWYFGVTSHHRTAPAAATAATTPAAVTFQALRTTVPSPEA